MTPADYLHWLFSGRWLILWPEEPMAAVGLVLAGLLLKWLICLRFIYLPLLRVEQEREKLHLGEIKRDRTFLWSIGAFAYGPLVEEVIFRALVLYLLLLGESAMAFAAVLLGAVVFGLVHRFNKTEYWDGSVLSRPWIAILSNGIGGLFYGLTVIATSSLWPAVFFHSFWNISFALIVEPNKYRCIELAKAMQPAKRP